MERQTVSQRYEKGWLWRVSPLYRLEGCLQGDAEYFIEGIPEQSTKALMVLEEFISLVLRFL